MLNCAWARCTFQSTYRFPAQLVRVGSIFWICLQGGEPPRRAAAIAGRAAELYGKIFHGLLARGISIAPSAYEVGFLSLAHTSEDLERLAAALADTFTELDA